LDSLQTNLNSLKSGKLGWSTYLHEALTIVAEVKPKLINCKEGMKREFNTVEDIDDAEHEAPTNPPKKQKRHHIKQEKSNNNKRTSEEMDKTSPNRESEEVRSATTLLSINKGMNRTESKEVSSQNLSQLSDLDINNTPDLDAM